MVGSFGKQRDWQCHGHGHGGQWGGWLQNAGVSTQGFHGVGIRTHIRGRDCISEHVSLQWIGKGKRSSRHLPQPFKPVNYRSAINSAGRRSRLTATHIPYSSPEIQFAGKYSSPVILRIEKSGRLIDLLIIYDKTRRRKE